MMMPRFSLLAGGLMLAGAICGSAAGPACAATVTTRTGTIKVICTLVTDATTAKGATFSFSVSARGSGANDAQSVSTTATVKKSANTQFVTLELPYKWTLPSAQNIVPISLNISGGVYPSSISVNVSQSIPLPANGAVTTVRFPARI